MHYYRTFPLWTVLIISSYLIPLCTADHHYDEQTNRWIGEIKEAEDSFTVCSSNNCTCYEGQIDADLSPFLSGINEALISAASSRGVRYQIIGGRVFRQQNCPFETRCGGVEHFLLNLAGSLPNLEFVLNVHDPPQVPHGATPLPIFSFSKDNAHIDILYPAWSFWAGGPATALYPKGIGRWNQTAVRITKEADAVEWENRKPVAFFRGSRTNQLRDGIVLLSRHSPHLVDAKYTKNQAWRSIKDTLGEQPAREVTFERHCHYKYLINFAGVAASFRLRHLLLCGSPVYHVGDRWVEFFYGALRPWIHYVPVSDPMTEMEHLLEFAQQHDDIMQRIGSRGRIFVESHLRETDVECYWRAILTKYSNLINYRIRRVSSFKTIHRSHS